MAPFFILALIKGFVLLILVMFYLPPVHKFLIPILSHFYSEYTLHFPRYYLLLPQIFNYASVLIIDLLFGVLLYAAAVFSIGTSYKREKGGLIEGLRTGAKSVGPLVTIWLLKTVLVFLVFRYATGFIFRLVGDLPLGYFIHFTIIQVMALIVIAFLIYSIPAIMLHRRKLGGALAESLRFTSKHFIFTFFLVFIPWVIQLPFDYIIYNKINVVLSKLNYAVAVDLLIVNIIAAMFTGYLLYSGITYFYISSTE